MHKLIIIPLLFLVACNDQKTMTNSELYEATQVCNRDGLFSYITENLYGDPVSLHCGAAPFVNKKITPIMSDDVSSYSTTGQRCETSDPHQMARCVKKMAENSVWLLAPKDQNCKLHDGYFHKKGEPECTLLNGFYTIGKNADIRSSDYAWNLSDVHGVCAFDEKEMPCELATALYEAVEKYEYLCVGDAVGEEREKKEGICLTGDYRDKEDKIFLSKYVPY